MNINPVRAVLLVALAVVGVLVIANGFSGTATVSAEATPEPTTPSPTPDKPAKNDGQATGATGAAGANGGQEKVDVTGVRIQTFNATAETGLAAQVQLKLEREVNATVAGTAGNADGTEATTTLYYQSPKDQALADELAAKYFPEGSKVASIADIPGVDQEIPKDVQVAIVVGEDYVK